MRRPGYDTRVSCVVRYHTGKFRFVITYPIVATRAFSTDCVRTGCILHVTKLRSLFVGFFSYTINCLKIDCAFIGFSVITYIGIDFLVFFSHSKYWFSFAFLSKYRLAYIFFLDMCKGFLFFYQNIDCLLFLAIKILAILSFLYQNIFFL